MLTLIIGNAETRCHSHTHIDVDADEEGPGAPCYIAYVYANETEYGAPCDFINVHVVAYEARGLHGKCDSYFLDES